MRDTSRARYLFKWVLVVLDHDLGPDQTHELDQRVHVAQCDVSEGTVFSVIVVSNV